MNYEACALMTRHVIFIDMTRTGSYRIELCDADDRYQIIRRAYRWSYVDIWHLACYYIRRWSVSTEDLYDSTRRI